MVCSSESAPHVVKLLVQVSSSLLCSLSGQATELLCGPKHLGSILCLPLPLLAGLKVPVKPLISGKPAPCLFFLVQQTHSQRHF